MRRHAPTLLDRIVVAALALGTVLLAVEVVLSLQWRMVHDTPLLSYVAFLIDRYGFVLYRDVLETSMPGTFLFHLAVGKLFGYGDRAFHFVDLAWLAALCAASWALMARFGRRAAWAGTLLAALVYLQGGPAMTLQKDYVGVLPVALAVLCCLAERPAPPARAALAGLFFGAACTVKPHLGISLPFALLYLWTGSRPADATPAGDVARGAGLALAALAGFALPIGLAFGWVWRSGGLSSFVNMFVNYMPLHLTLGNHQEVVEGPGRPAYLLQGVLTFGGMRTYLAPAAAGALLALRWGGLSRSEARAASLLALLTLLYAVYPAFSGQFWVYHYAPLRYFVALQCALALIPPRAPARAGLRWIGPAALAFALATTLRTPPDFERQLQGLPPKPPKNGRVDAIAAYLAPRLRPGDTVQPLDWASGAVHGLLLARARLATPFIYDYFFYHHLANPYIQTLRRRFIEDFDRSAPRFVVEIEEGRPRVRGPIGSMEFPELRERLARDYRKVAAGDCFFIYERVPASAP